MTEFFTYLFVGSFILAVGVVGFMSVAGLLAGVFALTYHTIDKS